MSIVTQWVLTNKLVLQVPITKLKNERSSIVINMYCDYSFLMFNIIILIAFPNASN